MLAMQYRFTLPADYDMAIIRQRIQQRGHLLDGFPQLEWKAYLWSERDGQHQGAVNAYAPLYLWQDNDGINQFLASPGFAAVCADFGRPQVDIWSVWACLGSQTMPAATVCYEQTQAIAPGTSLAALRQQEQQQATKLHQQGALCVLSAYDPQQWRILRMSAWDAEQDCLRQTSHHTSYQIGYVATKR
ncbi:DUF4865 family protein [Aquitalea aquatica]|uniref:DUF4865 family protein n=1 Tax=Aquitalea aquatica TaxID=3044273 RepID=A0A838YBD6_9NEIS|nr:DUF4865 family protein [Aquitalea magnusonii]MBA4707971.1 DUF4865 family protein [Aquitalea magnusonii]